MYGLPEKVAFFPAEGMFSTTVLCALAPDSNCSSRRSSIMYSRSLTHHGAVMGLKRDAKKKLLCKRFGENEVFKETLETVYCCKQYILSFEELWSKYDI